MPASGSVSGRSSNHPNLLGQPLPVPAEDLEAMTQLEESPSPSPPKAPRFPEFRQFVDDFETQYSILRCHADAIFQLTKQLVGLRTQMSDVQRFWTETGFPDVALRVNPILHAGKFFLDIPLAHNLPTLITFYHECWVVS